MLLSLVMGVILEGGARGSLRYNVILSRHRCYPGGRVGEVPIKMLASLVVDDILEGGARGGHAAL